MEQQTPKTTTQTVLKGCSKIYVDNSMGIEEVTKFCNRPKNI